MTGQLQPRGAVRNMREYHPPLAGRDGLLLDFNENTLAPSPVVAKALRQYAASRLTMYPEREPVERVVAASLGLAAEQVLLTNGVDEGIHLVCETFLDPADSAILVTPTFAMYANFAQSTGAKVSEVQACSNFSFPLTKILGEIDGSTRLIVFATPNNPTGSIASRAEIVAIAEAAPRAVVLVDEAYFHFHGETVIDLIERYPNLVVARTFSKAYGLAGLRIGLLAAHSETLRWVRKVATPYNVNALALAILPAAIADTEYVQWYCAQTLQGRCMLEQALDAAGVPRWPSRANFVLTHIGPRHAEFVAGLRARGILTRDRSRDPGCNGCVRITAGTPEQMPKAIVALHEVLRTMRWQPREAQ